MTTMQKIVHSMINLFHERLFLYLATSVLVLCEKKDYFCGKINFRHGDKPRFTHNNGDKLHQTAAEKEASHIKAKSETAKSL